MRIVLLTSLLTLYGAFSANAAPDAAELTQTRERPSMFLTATAKDGLRSVDAVRQGIQSGHGKVLWETLLATVDQQLAEPVVAPMQEKDGKLVLGNRPYTLISRAANRILDTALVALITEDHRYVEGALQQIMALFDENLWPEWSDQAHLNKGFNADLRHGQLVMPVALAYDWLYSQLTEVQRKAIIEGLDRCAITPYKAGYAAKEHWSQRRSNWMTVVLGGFGIAGMALGPDHPDSTLLVENSLAQMESYLDIVGPEGEFNESVQYAGSMANLVRYFMAVQYASGGTDTPFTRHSFSKFYQWYMLMTFPPGHVAGFGDPDVDMPPVVVPAAAVAAATQDLQLQWFYEQYNDKMLDSHRKRALELLYYDASLKAQSPQGVYPLAKAFAYQGKLVSSRSSWDPTSTTSVVYGKAGREDHHGHADWGQLCIDGYGERLVVDLGSPPGYPDGQHRYYYNYQQFGHNIFVFGENDTGGVSHRERERNGVYSWSQFDAQRGAAWSIDLGGVYEEGIAASRTVVHLLPRIAVVLDQATLPEAQPISLRWHLATSAQPDATGRFSLCSGKARLAGYVQRLDGETQLRTATHAYTTPYDKDRLGYPLKQKEEPYLELTANATHCTVLTLFAVQNADDEASVWQRDAEGWFISTPEGVVTVRLGADTLSVQGAGEQRWEVPIN